MSSVDTFSNKMPSIFKDFVWSWRGVTVKETSAFIPFSIDLLWDIWRGGIYIIFEKLRPSAPAITTAQILPRTPRPWYLIWGSLRQAGIDTSTNINENSLIIHFHDSTYTETNHSHTPSPKIAMNAQCTDISKTYVAQIFEQVFGYSLTVDPQTTSCPFVAKSEINGRHDGHILHKNTPAKEGRVYQRLIDNRSSDGYILDMRCPTVFGKIPLIYLKERPKKQRFANLNTKCRLAQTDGWLSEEEQKNISQFCHKIGLDWGGLDILRDNTDGRIYIVDANKTDMGPPLALKLRDKLRSTKILGRALREAVMERLS